MRQMLMSFKQKMFVKNQSMIYKIIMIRDEN